ncbi:MAG TPA: M36 family metallopeptidase, partial [Phycisphaerae bacterium]|nr:M36 family metallopeptidase [Phycisphaerae bacterium]
MGFTPHCHIRSRNKTHRRSAALLEALESRVLLAADLPLTGFEVPQHYLMLPAGYLTPRQPGSALDVARNYLAAHAPDLGLTVQDVLTAAVSSQYTDADTGLTHIYLSQQFGELQVENTSLTVTVTAAGQILNVAGGFYPAAADHVIATAAPISASLATRGAAALGLTVGNSLVISSQPGGEQWTVLSNASLSLDAITARLAYLPTAEGLRLVWNMPLRTPDNQHWYDLSVDAQTGTALQAFDWVDHATYDVFALPTESPADGSRSLVTDPHDPAASPFGWHDTNAVAGPEFTDTRGNNVSAQDDTDANNTGGNRPSGGATLNFDFPLDLTQSPSAYQSAAITNLFYWNNICHDIHYKY